MPTTRATYEGIFDAGRRTYFVKFKLGDQPKVLENGKLGVGVVYGASVFRRPLGSKGINTRLFATPKLNLDGMVGNKLALKQIKGNMETARKRYENWAVSSIKYERMVELPLGVRTRSQMIEHFKKKIFRKGLVNIFATLGMRWRMGEGPSLMNKEFESKKASLEKRMRRLNGVFDYSRGRFERRRKISELSSSGGEPNSEWEKHVGAEGETLPIHEISFIDQDRIFHVVYQRSVSGHTRYGACIYSPVPEWEYIPLNLDGSMDNECWDELYDMGYDEEDHFSTAQERFKYPVEVYLPYNKTITRGLANKMGRIDECDYEMVMKLRKKIAKYGVRARTGGNHNRFLTPHVWNNYYAVNKKTLNKEMGKLGKDFADWKKRSVCEMRNNRMIG